MMSKKLEFVGAFGVEPRLPRLLSIGKASLNTYYPFIHYSCKPGRKIPSEAIAYSSPKFASTTALWPFMEILSPAR